MLIQKYMKSNAILEKLNLNIDEVITMFLKRVIIQKKLLLKLVINENKGTD